MMTIRELLTLPKPQRDAILAYAAKEAAPDYAPGGALRLWDDASEPLDDPDTTYQTPGNLLLVADR